MITCNVLDYIVIMRITLSTEQCGWLVREVLCKPLLDRQTAGTGYWSFLPGFNLLSFSPLWRTIEGGTAYSHSIISEPLKWLYHLAFCVSRRTDTVRHTVEMDRWRAIDPDRSRKETEARVVVFAPSASQRVRAPASFTVKRAELYRRTCHRN
jgi:hypothetical protein